MEFTHNFMFFCGLLLCLSIIASILSNRLGSPLMLVFLAVGVFFGEDGPGGIVFNDMDIGYFVCSIALGIILFDGGLHTSYKSFRSVLRPAFVLATFGVLVTALITGFGVYLFFDFGIFQSLLFGSIVASTDAAAVFLLLRQQGVRLQDSLADTLEVESCLNDPMAIFLTITFVELLLTYSDDSAAFEILGSFLRQMGIGALLGYCGGKITGFIFDKINLDSGLYPIFAFAAGFLVFGASQMLGGSGFLSIYITGLILGNRDYKAKKLVGQFMGGLAWLSQLGMLLILGLLASPSELTNDIPTAFVLVLILVFVARPTAVFLSLLFSRFNWKEKAFISWVGLRGAIPIYLAIIPVMFGLEGHYFNITFIAVIGSVVLQGWTVGPAAHWLGVDQNNLRNNADDND